MKITATVKPSMWTRDSYNGCVPETYTFPSFPVDQERAPGTVRLSRHTSVAGRYNACPGPANK